MISSVSVYLISQCVLYILNVYTFSQNEILFSQNEILFFGKRYTSQNPFQCIQLCKLTLAKADRTMELSIMYGSLLDHRIGGTL